MNAKKKTHVVTVSVVMHMDEMDGSVYESAEIAMTLVHDALDPVLAHDYRVEVDDYYEEVK
jgi:hypothetical protein